MSLDFYTPLSINYYLQILQEETIVHKVLNLTSTAQTNFLLHTCKFPRRLTYQD